ncbi:MAG: glycosyltransferase family 2 protein [Archangium sp.]|nr:glycosyltransferase family 2 protein [Archangium sp.]
MTVWQADVVVPVYRDAGQAERCIAAVLQHSGASLRRLIVVDDAGPDSDVRPRLRALRDANDAVRLIENESNQGFVESCNRGLGLRAGHAVVLNADTEVTAGWLAELLAVLHGADDVAAVCPLSNNAGACTVPVSATPSGEVARALGVEALPRATELPTGVGFCMLMRGAALDALGGFDPAYGRGYNEENDWCQRARGQGWRVMRANRAFVFHQGESAFKGERSARDQYNGRRLVARYPRYLEEHRSFDASLDATLASRAVGAAARAPRVVVDARFLRTDGWSEGARAEQHLVRRLSVNAAVAASPEALLEADVVHVVGVPPLSAVREMVRRTNHLVVSVVDVPGALGGFSAAESWSEVRSRRAALWLVAQVATVAVPTVDAALRLSAFAGVAPADISIDGWQVEPPAVEVRAEARRRYTFSAQTALAVGIDEGTFDAWSAMAEPLTFMSPALASEAEVVVASAGVVVVPASSACIGYDEALARAAGVPVRTIDAWVRREVVEKAPAAAVTLQWPALYARLVSAPLEVVLTRRRRASELLDALAP